MHALAVKEPNAIEELELMADKEFMESYRKAKEQVKKRDFADWDEL